MTERHSACAQAGLNPPRRPLERLLELGGSGKPARLLFATTSWQGPEASAMERARDFTQTIGAEMHVLYLAGSEPGRATQVELNALSAAESAPQADDPAPAAAPHAPAATAATADAAEGAEAPEGARAEAATPEISGVYRAPGSAPVASVAPTWCQELFPQELVSSRVHVDSGDFVPTVVRHAEALDVALIIVCGHERPGARITALARHAATPVFVARSLAEGASTVLAATDLADESYPILRLAYKFGGFCHAPLVAVHNVAPKSLEVSMRARAPVGPVLDPETVAARLHALFDVTRRLGYETSVLSSMVDPVDAVLREAKSREVATIVVGTRAALTGDRGGVAAQVVNLASQSVLVIPLDPKEPGSSSLPVQKTPIYALDITA